MLPTVSVVIPAPNEERNIPHVFARIPADVRQAVLVDGGSVDGTVRVMRTMIAEWRGRGPASAPELEPEWVW